MFQLPGLTSGGRGGGELVELGPRSVVGGLWAVDSLAPRLHLSLCDKSISLAAVLHSHPAKGPGPSCAPVHT